MQHTHFVVENYLRELLLIYFSRQRLILTIATIILVAAISFAFLAKPLYSAQGTILVRSAETQRSPEVLEETELRVFKITEEDLRSEIELLRSVSVIQAAIARLITESYPNADQLDWLKIQKMLDTEMAPDSRVINIELKWNDANQAIVILDAIMDEYIIRRSEISYPEGSRDFFASQLDRFNRQVDQTERQLADLAKETRTPDPIKEIEYNLLSKQNLEQRLDTLLAEEAGLQEQIKYLDQVLASDEVSHFAFLRNETITDMASRLVDLQIERGKTARHYADDAKMVAVIDKQIRETANQMRREVEDYRRKIESDLASNVEQQSTLHSRIEAIVERNLKLYSQSLTTAKLNREAGLIEQSIATFFKRNEEAEINSQRDSVASQFYVTIINRAYTTGVPVFPNRPIIIVIGILAGLITGFSIGFIIEFFDHSFKTPRDVEQYSGLPLLFSVPLMKERCQRYQHEKALSMDAAP
jgi:uncharacterized protein involved in exopolysaccharide biosynthesis